MPKGEFLSLDGLWPKMFLVEYFIWILLFVSHLWNFVTPQPFHITLSTSESVTHPSQSCREPSKISWLIDKEDVILVGVTQVSAILWADNLSGENKMNGDNLRVLKHLCDNWFINVLCVKEKEGRVFFKVKMIFIGNN